MMSSNNSEFFGISSPKDMFEKAKREFQLLQNNLCTDTIFNFFITAYHIIDYIKALGTISDLTIQKMYEDEDFKMCQYICNKGKHSILREEPVYNNHEDSPPGSGKTFYTIIFENKRFHVEDIAERVIDKWEEFFIANKT